MSDDVLDTSSASAGPRADGGGTLPFPAVAAATSLPAVQGLALRRFGERAGDLDVPFGGDPLATTTALLHTCTLDQAGRAVDVELFMRLPLGDRLAALLALAGAVDGEPLAAVMRCVSCDEPLETLLPVDELVAYNAAAAQRPVHVTVDDRALAVRLPTALDLRRWQEGDAPARMLRELVASDEPLPDPLPAAWLSAIEAALAEADPLVSFRLSTSCPECGTAARYELDLQELALERLRAARHELLLTVHRLASAYHWSESEIIALPPDRRRLYLSMIESGR